MQKCANFCSILVSSIFSWAIVGRNICFEYVFYE